MKKSVKKRWVKALRSGEYKQCRSGMHDGEGFCCLGVLHDIEVDGHWQAHGAWWEAAANGRTNPGFLTDSDLLDIHLQLVAAEWNDDGLTFDQIANKIAAGDLDGKPL